MTDVIHEHDVERDSSGGPNLIFGVVLLIIVAFFLFYFFGKNMSFGGSSLPSHVNVNVQPGVGGGGK